MTFKHIKFEDSPVMRSLERMTLEGNSPIEKKASKEIPKKDMLPTENVFENLTKLCSGLRDIGLGRYADELEHNYMDYKQADAAYLTNSKDNGEKMLQDAHPEGSPKISDSEYAIIENIIDQHLKTIKQIEKMPTGKLSSSAEIIDAVKISLGNDIGTSIDARKKAAYAKLLEIIPDLNNIMKEMRFLFKETTYVYKVTKMNYNEAIRGIKRITVDNISLGLVNEVITDVHDMNQTVSLLDWKDIGLPGLAGAVMISHVVDFLDAIQEGGFLTSSRERVVGLIENVEAKLKYVVSILNGEQTAYVKRFIEQEQKKQIASNSLLPEETQLISSINNARNTLTTTKISIRHNSSIASDMKVKLYQWIDDRNADINDIYNAYNRIKDEDHDKKKGLILRLQNRLNSVTYRFNDFQSKWAK